MDQYAKPKKKRRFPYWAAMLLGVVGCAITANAFTIALQLGAFNTWASLPDTPPGTAQIVDADDTNVWVKTGDNDIYWYELYCVGKDTCRQWAPVRSASEIKASRVVPLQRGRQCPKSASDLFPVNPAGGLVQCVLVAYPGPEMGSVTYYALMADGTVKLWRNSGSLIATYAFFFLSTIILPIVSAIIISALYLGIRIGRRQQREDQEYAAKNSVDS